MTPGIALILSLGSCLAAGGQLFFKLGAQKAATLSPSLMSPSAWLNAYVFFGLLLYSLGTVLWLYALARAPLYMVYPFTLLTFVLVGILGMYLLGERPGWTVMLGWGVIVVGIAIAYLGAAKSA